MKRLSDRAQHRGTRTKTSPNEATAVAIIASVMLNPQIYYLLGLLKDNMIYQDQ